MSVKHKIKILMLCPCFLNHADSKQSVFIIIYLLTVQGWSQFNNEK